MALDDYNPVTTFNITGTTEFNTGIPNHSLNHAYPHLSGIGTSKEWAATNIVFQFGLGL